jgi:hypothetical protein
MTRSMTLKNIAWPAFIASVAIGSWALIGPALVDEPMWVGLVFSAGVAALVCGVVYVFVLMRPAFRWLTLAAAICAGAFMLYNGQQEVPVWIFVPGAFGIVWIRYLIDSGKDLSALGKRDFFNAAALALLLCLAVVGMMSVQRYFQKQVTGNSSAMEQLIEWE